jgi:pyruvate dehydrogenase E1 component beta subunit
MTGAAVGAAIVGMRPVVVHPRCDFMMYALDPIINEAANWRYMSGGCSQAPVVFWGVINRAGEQAAQHSQAIQAFFAHTPGLKVVMPATPYDAKGLMVAAIQDDDPVVFIDDRWLYGVQGDVPEDFYSVPLGKGVVHRQGKDITIVAVSYLVQEALAAAEELEKSGISVEVVDPRTIKPLDTKLIVESAKKTGRVVVADPGWQSFGVAAEISALIAEHALSSLKAPVRRVCLPDIPAPAARTLEAAYYPKEPQLIDAVHSVLKSS